MSIRVLGEVSVVDAAGRSLPLGAASRSVIGTLVAAGSRGATIGDFFDPARPPTEAQRESVTSTISRLRSRLSATVMPTAVNGRYVLALPSTSVDAWHLALLAGGAPLGSTPIEGLRSLVLPGPSYGDAPMTPIVSAAAAGIRQQQVDLLLRIDSELPAVANRLLGEIDAHVELDPFNQRLVAMAVRSLLASGRHREALGRISALRRELIEIGHALSEEVAVLERAALAGEVPTGRRGERPIDDAAATLTTDVDTRRSWIGNGELIAAATELFEAAADIDSTQALVVGGESGVGKSRALDELVRRAAARGCVTVSIVGEEVTEGAALGSLAAAVPELHAMPSWAPSGGAHDSIEEAAWDRFVEGLVRRSGGGPLLVAVDDAQWLDDRSAQMLVRLVATATPMPTVVLVAGRPDEHRPEAWSTLATSLGQLGVVTHVVQPLDVSEMIQLIRTRRRDLSALRLESFAADVHKASSGLPGIAVPLIAAAGGGAAHDPEHDPLEISENPWRFVVGRLRRSAQRVGQAAAVLGTEFETHELEAVLDVSRAEVAAALDDLLQAALLVRRSPTRFAMHRLANEAFITSAGVTAAAEFHLAAAATAVDVHVRARHLYAAQVLADRSEVYDAVIASARLHHLEGNHGAAARQFARSSAVRAGQLDLSDAIASSRSLDLIGDHDGAARHRQPAFGRAIAAGDHETAFRLAISGLPEADQIDGDTRVIEQLCNVDPEHLSPSSAWEHAWNLARSATLGGRPTLAARWIDRAESSARSDDQRVRAAVVRRHSQWAQSPHLRLATLDEVRREFQDASTTVRAEYLVCRAVDAYEAGAMGQVESLIEELDVLPMLEPRRRWHGELLRSSIFSDRGELARASELRQESLRYAIGAGISEGEFAMLAPIFVDAWVRGAHGALIGAIDGGEFDTSRKVLMRAVAAQVRSAVGQVDQALRLAVDVIERAAAEPVVTSLNAVAIVASVLGDGSTAVPEQMAGRVADARMQAVDMLLPVEHSLMIIGAGSVCLGPVGRYLAALGVDRSEREAALRRSIDLVDAAGLTLWQVLVRRDLWRQSGSSELVDEVEELVAGSELAEFSLRQEQEQEQ